MKAKFFVAVLILCVSLSINVAVFGQATAAGEIKIAAVDSPNDFHFAVMGDRTGGEAKGVYEHIIGQLNMMCPAFVVSTGDNIQGYTKDANAVDKMWNEWDGMIKKLNVPFLKVAGNHDMSNAMQAEIYQKRFGSPYYYSIYKNVLFLFLNSNDPTGEADPKALAEMNADKKKLKEMAKTQGVTAEGLAMLAKLEVQHRDTLGGKISDTQFEFFKKVLEDNKNVRWTFVLMHQPMWKQTNPPANWVKLEEILKSRPYTVFAGHEHVNTYTLRNNRDYIVMSTSGAGGVPRSFAGVYQHVLWVTVSGEEPAIANILSDGILEKTFIKPGQKDINDVDIKRMLQ